MEKEPKKIQDLAGGLIDPKRKVKATPHVVQDSNEVAQFKNEIATSLEHAFSLMGLKEENFPDRASGKVIVNWVCNKHSDLKPLEIIKAFELAIEANNENLTKHYQSIGVDYVHKILTWYKKGRDNARARDLHIKLMIGDIVDDERKKLFEHDQIIKRMIVAAYKGHQLKAIEPAVDRFSDDILNCLVDSKMFLAVIPAKGKLTMHHYFDDWIDKGITNEQILNRLKKFSYIGDYGIELMKHNLQKIKNITI